MYVMGGWVARTPVQATVRTLGCSMVPQVTRVGGTGARRTLPFQCCFAIGNFTAFLLIVCVGSLPRYFGKTPAVHFVYCIMSDANCQFSKSFPGAIDILSENPV